MITDEARDRILEWAKSNHLSGGLSGAVEYLAYHLEESDEQKPAQN